MEGYLRIYRLILLLLGIQADILDGTQPTHLTLANFVKVFPNDQVEQRVYFKVMIVNVSQSFKFNYSHPLCFRHASALCPAGT